MEKLKRIGKFLVDHKPIFMVILGCFFLLSPPYYSDFKFLYALSAWLWPFFFFVRFIAFICALSANSPRRGWL